jgi:hypothetical protein
MAEFNTTHDEIQSLINNYVDSAHRELVHSGAAYQSRDGKVTRSSVIGARRGDIDVEITISVTCKQLATRDI